MVFFMQLTHLGQGKVKAQPLTGECQSIRSLFALLQRDLPFATLLFIYHTTTKLLVFRDGVARSQSPFVPNSREKMQAAEIETSCRTVASKSSHPTINQKHCRALETSKGYHINMK